MSSITTTSMPAAAEFKATFEANSNIIVSTKPGQGAVTQTLAELRSLTEMVLIVDALALTEITPRHLDHTAEIVVVDEVHPTRPLIREQIAELMLHRTLNGEAMPELKSVVVFFTHSNQETDRYAAQLAGLSPSLSINLN